MPTPEDIRARSRALRALSDELISQAALRQHKNALPAQGSMRQIAAPIMGRSVPVALTVEQLTLTVEQLTLTVEQQRLADLGDTYAAIKDTFISMELLKTKMVSLHMKAKDLEDMSLEN